jgi:SAM-dependent methyltransferase
MTPQAGTGQIQRPFIPEVPFVPTPHEVVAEILRLADVKEGDILYDLGCGDGRIVITAAREFGCRGVGIDIDPERIRESRENAAEAGVEELVEFVEMDLFEADISEATVVTLYLLSRVNIRLRPKLFDDLKPGTRIVSHDFDMDEWEADEISYIQDEWETHSVFFWIIPADVSGIWRLTMPDVAGPHEFVLFLEQNFQKLSGQAREGASPLPVFIKDEKIRGAELEFILERSGKNKKERLVFRGKAEGDTITGVVSEEGAPAGSRFVWKAKRRK